LRNRSREGLAGRDAAASVGLITYTRNPSPTCLRLCVRVWAPNDQNTNRHSTATFCQLPRELLKKKKKKKRKKEKRSEEKKVAAHTCH
jgi:hypothetical protein